LSTIETDAQAQAFLSGHPLFASTLNFMPRDRTTSAMFAEWLGFFLKQPKVKAGVQLTEPHFSVHDRIVPRTTPAGNRYTGRILVLIDELNLSAAEYVAATLQDNARATLFGTTTSGAGGDQRIAHRERLCNEAPVNPLAPCVPKDIAELMREFGVTSYRYTVTLGERVRPDGALLGPIENVGVIPDIVHTIAAGDLTTDFQFYSEGVRNALRGL
jgi:C-terminal processing protease CtpA/Prc